MIRVILPFHLRNLAGVGAEVSLDVDGPVTQRSILDALEARYPMLRGTIRDHTTKQRRSYLRFFACREDLSHESPDAPLPKEVASGEEPFRVLGAIAGGQGDKVNPAYKPEDYSTVSPYLVVDGAGATISFLKRVFDAQELRRFPDERGKLLHAEVRIGDTVVMLADSNEDWQPTPSYVHVYVEDVDETYRKALAAGATSVQEPVKKEDEDKRGGVTDPVGTTWWIATRVE